MKPQAVLLAAGRGSRFGGDKMLAPLADGTPIGVASWRNLSHAIAKGVAVVRCGDTTLRGALQAEGANVVECADAKDGMSRSLIAGLQATPNYSGWVIALGDMPFIKPATIRKIANAIGQGALIAVPVCDGKRGHPVGLSASLRRELMAITGDEGARELVKRHASECRLIDCSDDPGILRDIDTPDDLA
ncbi:MAG: nucleotidyltransferase family protein [Betaproteobacteria bacterium]|jgi:molybdenum cofactor cytidylyltransferase|nr:MAG: nucleotidyltransferase family protein [Betaproteobacteria bacterium]